VRHISAAGRTRVTARTGDTTTKDRDSFPFFPHRPCQGFQEVLSRYREITPLVNLSGPTSFAPVITKAIETVRANGNSVRTRARAAAAADRGAAGSSTYC
jgi:hypothetical protein